MLNKTFLSHSGQPEEGRVECQSSAQSGRVL